MQDLIDTRAPYPAHYRSRFRNRVQRKTTLAFLVWLLIILPLNSINAQTKKTWTRADLISAARETMNTARYCALITTNPRGGVDARTMDAFAPDEKMTVWLATNPRSRKVTDIRRNAWVTLYYFDRENQAYVTIQGTARLVNDPAEKARHWKPEWSAFYPNRDRDYLLIKVVPTRLEVVDTKKGIVGDSKSWRPPTVLFPKSN